MRVLFIKLKLVIEFSYFVQKSFHEAVIKMASRLASFTLINGIRVFKMIFSQNFLRDINFAHKSNFFKKSC